MMAFRPKSAQAMVTRARIVLACAQGLSNSRAAQKLYVTGHNLAEGCRNGLRPAAPDPNVDFAEKSRSLAFSLSPRVPTVNETDEIHHLKLVFKQLVCAIHGDCLKQASEFPHSCTVNVPRYAYDSRHGRLADAIDFAGRNATPKF